MLGLYKRGLAVIIAFTIVGLWYKYLGDAYIQEFISNDIKLVIIVILLLLTLVPLLLGWLVTFAVEKLQ